MLLPPVATGAAAGLETCSSERVISVCMVVQPLLYPDSLRRVLALANPICRGLWSARYKIMRFPVAGKEYLWVKAVDKVCLVTQFKFSGIVPPGMARLE